MHKYETSLAVASMHSMYLLHSRFLSLQQCYSPQPYMYCISPLWMWVCLFVPVFGSSALDKDDTTRNYDIHIKNSSAQLKRKKYFFFCEMTMRRSFKERGKRLLNKFSSDNTAAGEICVAAVLQNNIECKNFLFFIYFWPRVHIVGLKTYYFVRVDILYRLFWYSRSWIQIEFGLLKKLHNNKIGF